MLPRFKWASIRFGVSLIAFSVASRALSRSLTCHFRYPFLSRYLLLSGELLVACSISQGLFRVFLISRIECCEEYLNCPG